MSAYESPIHELSYAVLLVSKLQVFSEIWQDDYRSVGTVLGQFPPLFPSVDLRGAIGLSNYGGLIDPTFRGAGGVD